MLTRLPKTLKNLLIFFSLLLILPSPLISPSLTASQIDNLVIEKIDIIGNVPEGAHFDPSVVKGKIKTRQGDFFSQIVFDNDLKTLATEYDRIEPSFEVINKKLIITLKVWPKPLIRSIIFRGNNHINSKDLQKELEIKICTVFDRLAFNKAFQKIKAYYVKKGYFEAELNYRVVDDPATQEVDIEVIIDEGRSGWISRIHFEGFHPDEEEDIAEMMVTKKLNFFLSWLSNEGLYNEEAINYDQNQIINYLQNRGYADAVVTIEPRDSTTFCERIHLYITANRGERYTIGKLSFEGNLLFCNEEIENLFLVKEGGWYSPERIQETATRIESLYGRKGYIDASVSYEPKLVLDDPCFPKTTYSIHYTIEEGTPYNVGLIKVFGNDTTQTNVILHETLLTPGEVFNTEKLKRTEERLKNIGYFSDVNVYAVRSEHEGLPGNYRDVHVEVAEQQTGKFGTFLGYSTAESVFGGINITEKNFNSAGLASFFDKDSCDPCNQSLRGGGEFLSTTIQLGQKGSSYGLSWTKPYFLDTNWSVGFDIEYSKSSYISSDYDIKALGYNLRANYEINSFMRFGWHYRIRNSRVNLDDAAKLYFTDPELYCASKIRGLISATGVSFGYDSTDRFDMPTRGFRSILEAEFAGVGGDHTFWGFAYLNSYYLSPRQYFPDNEWMQEWVRGTLKFRADFRFLLPTGGNIDNLPLDERIYLGGVNVVRGFKEYKMGPQFENTDPKGGVSMQIYSIEYNQVFNKRFTGFLFIDAGHLSDQDFSMGPVYWSYGAGARLKVMDSFPPVTLGLGFPVNPRKDNWVKNFFMSFGANF